MVQRRHRNRNRSKRRSIYCPAHGCYLDSVSSKHMLYASKAEHLQQRGMARKPALMLTAHRQAVPLTGEWLEAFWCSECQESRWYHVRKQEKANCYQVSPAPEYLWKQAAGVIDSAGNPSSSEFSRRQARALNFNGIKDYQRIG